MKKSSFVLFTALGAALGSVLAGVPPSKTQVLTVTNRLNLARKAETISLPMSQLRALAERFGPENILVKDAASGKVLVSQLLDNDADGRADELIFQTDVPARGERKFVLSSAKNAAAERPQSPFTTFSRFVPERTDDYAWENERVAFRTYGPVAQQLFEAGKKDGTLSSGMDCWLKRVSFLVIDKWYAGYVVHPGFYHKDIGEGYDPYHVGVSRGCGGIGVWDHDQLYVSKNFTSYKTLATGPIRTVFELTYAPWDANGRTVTEKKRISLDLGSNLTRYEEQLSCAQPLPNCTIGLTLHNQKGTVKADSTAGWFRYWEPVDDSEMGTGVVITPAALLRFADYRTEKKDLSQLHIEVKLANKVVYYAGFGWKKSGQYASAAEWDAYLSDFSRRLASPLQVKFN